MKTCFLFFLMLILFRESQAKGPAEKLDLCDLVGGGWFNKSLSRQVGLSVSDAKRSRYITLPNDSDFLLTLETLNLNGKCIPFKIKESYHEDSERPSETNPHSVIGTRWSLEDC